MVSKKTLADVIAAALAANSGVSDVTEVGDGIYGVTYNGVGYSVMVNVTP